MNPQPTIEAMRTAAQVLSSGDVREKLHALQEVQDAVDAAKSMLLAELQASKEFELDGASTLNAWVRNQLRLKPGQASILVRNVQVLGDLSLVAEAALAGKMSAAHVAVFAYGLRHIGLESMREFEAEFVDVALARAPGDLFEAVKHLQDVLHPEDLDEKYLDGMEKEDFSIDALPDGFHVTGFLNTVTGSKLKRAIDALSAPTGVDDTRTGAERRVQAVDDLASAFLGSGLPADKGVKPHMSVFVDAETLAAAAAHVEQTTKKPYLNPPPMPATEPAVLAGHGAIGPQLLMMLTCMAAVTPIVMKDGQAVQSQILNVGTAMYSPNLRQRKGVIARQMGECAAPGCKQTHLEIHHSIWWSLGGPTDIDLLIGLCTRCHHLVHRNLLQISGDAVSGFVFTTRDGRRLRRRRRTGYRRAA
ncbi:HNH endonuclease signature motif containing protein [Aeromicrobium stalagmiti]|uniref:HNH endonuclease signature motif containing protein n=1 Tax=Aeromicrobium stalagmiti TaxID=2738988 RepID=UPI00156A2749|nr:HNH endonuclease signature motif containing protein [Aeromicrobium stalagmiti]NRQ51117.1 DUF222 domain-containing protein [Aeromicrobium stalagmiti]